MNLPSRRVLAAIAVILAGIAAVSVPFLLHSPTPQASSGTGGGGSGSTTTNNNNGHTTTGTNPTTTTSPTNPASNPTGSSGACDEDNSPDPGHTDHGKHKGEQKHSDLQTVKDDVDKAFAMVKHMGEKNPAFHSTHSTDTDNDSVHGNSAHAHASHHTDNGCAEDEEDSDE